MRYYGGDGRDIVYAVLLFGSGIYYFFKGFKRLQAKRLIENIPTSTVRGLAMGLVELGGRARNIRIFKSPLAEMECVFYRYTVEQYVSTGRSGYWKTIAQGDSYSCPFWLEDGTGIIMVDPREAELIMSPDYEFQTGFRKSLPDKLKGFMFNHGLPYEGFLGTYKLRFKEWFILPEEKVYVLGTAQKSDYPRNYREQLTRRLEVVKATLLGAEISDSAGDVDSSGDSGKIAGEDEWKGSAAEVERRFLEEALSCPDQDDETDVVIGKGDQGQAFIISDKGQAQLGGTLCEWSGWGVFGGAVLSIAAFAYLVFRIGLLLRWY
jgi:hypothetical protein